VSAPEAAAVTFYRIETVADGTTQRRAEVARVYVRRVRGWRYVVRWRTPVMPASAFEYFRTRAAADRTAAAICRVM
jgi:hypothetical protein